MSVTLFQYYLEVVTMSLSLCYAKYVNKNKAYGMQEAQASCCGLWGIKERFLC